MRFFFSSVFFPQRRARPGGDVHRVEARRLVRDRRGGAEGPGHPRAVLRLLLGSAGERARGARAERERGCAGECALQTPVRLSKFRGVQSSVRIGSFQESLHASTDPLY